MGNSPSVINGQWGPYKTVTECSVECNGGTLTESRKCNNPAPANGGKTCSGDTSRILPCNAQGCPVNGEFSPWVTSSSCSKDCGTGVFTEIRQCNNPTPANGGTMCEGPTSENLLCNTQRCPVNGGFSDWINYGSCSAPCNGGIQTERRLCNNPAPEFGGNECFGETYKTVKCNETPCKINGGYTEWSVPVGSVCSKSCGTGTMLETRSCTNPSPAFGGDQCIGPAVRNELKCNEIPCKLTKSECNGLTDPINGIYPRECLEYWWQDAGCTNKNFIENLPVSSWYDKQTPAVVRQDFKNWSVSTYSPFKSTCLPLNYTPTNPNDCKLSSKFWNQEKYMCDINLGIDGKVPM
jgi:hypothetical protein